MSLKSFINVFQIIQNYHEIMRLYQLDKYIKTNSNKVNIKEQNDSINDIEKNENQNIENNNLQLNTYKKIIAYKSQMISKIEISMELIYNLFFREKGK